MSRARRAARTAGSILLLTSLLAVVLILAFALVGPALVVAIFSAVILLAPLAGTFRAPAPVFVGARRRRFTPRAPPAF
jgi:hypothetical protein